MAGMEFFNGMAPGLARMFSALADNSLEAKGYKLGADYAKSAWEAKKIADELNWKNQDRERTLSAIDQHLSGLHGVDPGYVRALRTGEDVSQFNYSPDVSRSVMRDLGALSMGDPSKISLNDVTNYNTGMAELGGKQARSAAAMEILNRLRGGMPIDDTMRALSAVQAGAQMIQPTQTSAENRVLDMFLDPQQRKIAEQYLQMRHAPMQINNWPSGFERVIVNGKPTIVQVGKNGEIRPIGEAIDTRNPLDLIIAQALKGQGGQAPSVPQANPGAIPSKAANPQQSGPTIAEYNGKKYRLRPGANPDLRSSWEEIN